ncbi:unnamed protein product [Caenorhabditis bovis]|uniref:Uncharacterized protein n=1 Tax=Caenorhabditis bovis TaxID=2654633 RepID=A0A8S1EGA3_9PELO|nr:unnamed protein product [Caenorhabditis bovis]
MAFKTKLIGDRSGSRYFNASEFSLPFLKSYQISSGFEENRFKYIIQPDETRIYDFDRSTIIDEEIGYVKQYSKNIGEYTNEYTLNEIALKLEYAVFNRLNYTYNTEDADCFLKQNAYMGIGLRSAPCYKKLIEEKSELILISTN